MAVDYVALAATAERLIEANGRSVVVVKQGSDPQDSEEPWRGQACFDDVTVTGEAVFIGMNDLDFGFLGRDNDNVNRASQLAFFAANNDGGNLLEDFHVIRDDGVDWRIQTVNLLAPGSTRIVYMFEVER